jgi:hypothetical protein
MGWDVSISCCCGFVCWVSGFVEGVVSVVEVEKFRYDKASERDKIIRIARPRDELKGRGSFISKFNEEIFWVIIVWQLAHS